MIGDLQFVYDIIGEFWQDVIDRTLYENVIWKTMIDWAQDTKLHLDQIADLKSVENLPVNIEHTWLYRDANNWKTTGGFHQHYRHNFEVVDPLGQQAFTFTVPIDKETAQVYVDGKLLSVTDDYRVTMLYLIFGSMLPIGTLVTVIADQVTRVPLTSKEIALPVEINPLNNNIYLDMWDITSLVNYTSGTPDSITVNDGDFYPGELIYLNDGTNTEYVSVTAEVSSLPLVNTYILGTLQVFRVLNVLIDKNNITMVGKTLSLGSQLPPNIAVTVSDVKGKSTVTYTTPSSTFVFPREFDWNTLEVRIMNGSLLNYVVSSSVFTTTFAFTTLCSVYLVAKITEEHTHKSYVVDLPTNTSSVVITDDFTLSLTLTEQPEHPVKVFLDGMLLHNTYYRFTAIDTIQFWDPSAGVPAAVSACNLTIIYTVIDAAVYHIHSLPWRILEVMADTGTTLPSFVELDVLPQEVYLDGTLRSDYAVTENKHTIFVSAAVPVGTVIQMNVHSLDLPFYHDIDADITEQYFYDNKLPISCLVKAESLQDNINGVGTLMDWTEPDITPVIGEFTIRYQKYPSYVRVYSSYNIDYLWFKDAEVNENTLYNTFGVLFNLPKESTTYMRNTIMAFVEALWKGSQEEIIINFANIIFGSVFSETAEERLLGNTGLTVTTSNKVYAVDDSVPKRLTPTERLTFKKHHAFNEYVSKYTEDTYLAPLAQDVSPDYRVANRLDHKEDAVILGAGTGYISSGNLVDMTKDFLKGQEGEVWDGDAMEITDLGGNLIPCVITDVVDLHTLSFTTSLVIAGGVAQYRVFARRTVRLDDGGSLDRALEIDQVNDRLKDILVHIQIFKLNFNSLFKDGKYQTNLGNFLERALPAWQRHAIIAPVAISSTTNLKMYGGELDVIEDGNWLALDISPIDGGSPIGGGLL